MGGKGRAVRPRSKRRRWIQPLPPVVGARVHACTCLRMRAHACVHRSARPSSTLRRLSACASASHPPRAAGCSAEPRIPSRVGHALQRRRRSATTKRHRRCHAPCSGVHLCARRGWRLGHARQHCRPRSADNVIRLWCVTESAPAGGGSGSVLRFSWACVARLVAHSNNVGALQVLPSGRSCSRYAAPSSVARCMLSAPRCRFHAMWRRCRPARPFPKRGRHEGTVA